MGLLDIDTFCAPPLDIDTFFAPPILSPTEIIPLRLVPGGGRFEPRCWRRHESCCEISPDLKGIMVNHSAPSCSRGAGTQRWSNVVPTSKTLAQH